jgi:hypothetical protein
VPTSNCGRDRSLPLRGLMIHPHDDRGHEAHARFCRRPHVVESTASRY